MPMAERKEGYEKGEYMRTLNVLLLRIMSHLSRWRALHLSLSLLFRI